jgi:hypothetical protein
MNRCGLKCVAVGTCLTLLLLGAQWARERQRYQLRTPNGLVCIGMTWDEVKAAIGPPAGSGSVRGGRMSRAPRVFWDFGSETLYVRFDSAGKVDEAAMSSAYLPGLSLFDYIRSWFTGED